MSTVRVTYTPPGEVAKRLDIPEENVVSLEYGVSIVKNDGRHLLLPWHCVYSVEEL